MKTTISRYMKHSHGEDSYNLTEEIAVRSVFRTIRPDYLADYFNTAFYELAGDIYAQARLVDIGLRFENNLALNLAAARKIRTLLDEHKILMIPAYIEAVVPEVSAVIASAIPTIRASDPRRYFLERWMHHEHPEVARICREALAGGPAECLPARGTAEPAMRQIPKETGHTGLQPERRPDAQEAGRKKTAHAARTGAKSDARAGTLQKKNARDRANSDTDARTIADIQASFVPGDKSRTNKKNIVPRKGLPSSGSNTAERRKIRPAAPEYARNTVPAAEADSFGYEKLIALIDRHIGDPKPKVRLKWVQLIGHIPERLDPDDEHKMRFISIGLSDQVQEVCLEAIAQIEFLIHDRSKLALLLKIIDSKSPLIRSKEAADAIKTLSADGRRTIENLVSIAEKKKSAETKKVRPAARTDETSGPDRKPESESPAKTAESPSAPVSEAGDRGETPTRIAETISPSRDRAETDRSEKPKTEEPSNRAVTRQVANNIDAPVYSAEQQAEIAEIVGELDLPAEALAELERENTPSSLLITEIAPRKEVPHVDNYFLRHSAVLHIKNIHEEELRFELYQTVLKHDPKDLVRQIAVEEARNLKREHVRPILRLGLEDPAWQVRSDALEYLLPFLSGTDEERQILRECVNDSDYHIRQKADEKLLTMSRRSASP